MFPPEPFAMSKSLKECTQVVVLHHLGHGDDTRLSQRSTGQLWAVGLFVYDVKMLCETAIVWHGILSKNKLETHILLSWN